MAIDTHRVCKARLFVSVIVIPLVEEDEVRYSICAGCSSSDQEAGTPEFDQLLDQAKSAFSDAKKESPATIVHWTV